MKTRFIEIFWTFLIILSCPLAAVSQVQLQNIRFGQHSGYDRIVFDFSGPVEYNIVNQQEDRKIYLTFHDCVSGNFEDGFVKIINDNILNSVYLKKVAENDLIVRILVNPEYRYRFFKQEHPWRLVADIFTVDSPAQNKAGPSAATFQGNLKSQEEAPPAITNARDSIFQVQDNLNQQEEEAKPQYEFSKKVIDKGIDSLALVSRAIQDPAATGKLKDKSAAILPTSSEMISGKFPFAMLIISAFIINCFLFIGYFAIVKKKKNNRQPEKFKKDTATIKTNAAKNHSEPDFKSLLRQKMDIDLPGEKHSANNVDKISRPTSQIPVKQAQDIVKEYSRFQKQAEACVRDENREHEYQSIPLRTERVEKLVQRNYDIKHIARELNLGQDEIKMIINLNKKKGSSRLPVKQKSLNRFAFA